jgi:Na+-transporting methylmalonyl-CoA/oxaloacetate decarboxylase gamma subunit
MKKIKKVIPLLAVLVFVFSFGACGEDPRTMDYNGYTYEDLQGACQNTAMTLEQMSYEDAAMYMDGSSDTTSKLVTSWMENRAQVGDFLGFGDFEVVKSGKTLTAAQTINYSIRPMVLTYVFNATSMEVTDIMVDLVYTTGEKMSKAGLNTVLCLLVVFAVLIIISLVIAAFNIIPKIQNAMKKPEPVEESPKTDFVEQIAERETAAVTEDTALIAVIAAAIAADTGTSPDGFVVRSIKRRV